MNLDNGYSGVNFERPAVQQLLELVRESKIDCLIVKDFSRFGRNSIETGYFIEMVFPIFRTRFISISDGFDSEDFKEDTGGMQVAFKFLMHEYYSHDMSKKSKTAKYAKFKRGEYQSSICPYGYKKGSNGRMEVDEEAATVVRLIFEQALTMRNTSDIAKFLYEHKIPTPGEHRKAQGKSYYDCSRANGIWQSSQIYRILDDERYIGTYVIGKREITEIGGSRSRLKPESEWIKLPGHHPAIISKELYEKVKASLPRFKCSKSKRPDYPLKSKIVCGCCRHVMQIVARLQRAFVCKFSRVDETADCYKLEIGELELEDLLFSIVSKQAQEILQIDNLWDSANIPIHTEQQVEYEKRIEQLHEDRRKLYERLVLETLAEETYKVEKVAIDIELSNLCRAYESFKTETAIIEASKSAYNEIHHIAESVNRESKLSRAIVEMLIDKVYVYPGNRIEISWKVEGFAANVKEGTNNAYCFEGAPDSM